MLAWLGDNATWIFSGIGIVAVSLLGRLAVLATRGRSANGERSSQRQRAGLQAGRDIFVQQFFNDLADTAPPSRSGDAAGPNEGSGTISVEGSLTASSTRQDPVSAFLRIDTDELSNRIDALAEELRQAEQPDGAQHADRRRIRANLAKARAELEEHEFMRQRLREALECFSDRAQTYLGLHYFEGLTHAQVAYVLGIEVEQVERKLSLLLQMLRGVLPAAGGGEAAAS